MFLIMSLRKYFLNKMTTNPLDTLNFSIEHPFEIITNGAIATKKKKKKKQYPNRPTDDSAITRKARE